jgi:polysaccharide deacetylase 2 family uncharacterized protein YibQ
MVRRSSRRRSSRAKKPPALSSSALIGVAVTCLFLGAGIVGIKWLQTDAGRLFLAEHEVASAERWVEPRIEAALRSGIEAAGADADSLQRSRNRLDGPAVLRLATEADLLRINYEVTQAVRAAGGRVYRGHRWRSDEAEILELQVGTSRRLTHRLLVQRGDVLPEPAPLPRGQLALVVDDFGHNLGPLVRRLLALDAPLTMAILPDLSHSRDALREISRAGKQALLHLPMEPDPGAPVEPGPRFVKVGMSDEEVERLVEDCLDELPGVQGMNNHMGSRATRSRPEMEAVMRVLAGRGLIFLDSLTTPKSVAHRVAREMGVPRLTNNLFVDRETEEGAVVLSRLEELAERARERGFAVGIGHVNEATVEALESFVPALRPGDVELVFLADLVHERAGVD